MKIAHAVEQRPLDASHYGEAGVALHLSDQRRLIDLTEDRRNLIQKPQEMAAEVEIAQLPGNDDLKDHASLVRGAVERRST